MIYNLLPDFFWIGPLMVAPILRPVVAIVLLALAVKTFKHAPAPRNALAWSIASVYAALAVMFFLGLFTQYAALLGIVFTSGLLILKKRMPGLYRDSGALYLLLDAVFLSLFVTGAGPLALDSPL